MEERPSIRGAKVLPAYHNPKQEYGKLGGGRFEPLRWHRDKLDEVVWEVDKEIIWSIPLSERRREDPMVWHFDPK